MARYIKSISQSRIAGSRGGSTFTRTANGFIIRKRYMPKSSRNPETTRNRARFLASVQNYRSLSPGEKITFDNQAPNFTRTNSLGETYSLSNIQLASSQSFNALELSEPIPTTATPPVVFTPIALGGAGWNLEPPFLQVVPSIDPLPNDIDLLIWLSPAGDWSILSVPVSEMRLAITVPASHSGPIDLLPDYRRLFGVERWTANQVIIIGFQQYKRNSGQKSDINYSAIGLVLP